MHSLSRFSTFLSKTLLLELKTPIAPPVKQASNKQQQHDDNDACDIPENLTGNTTTSADCIALAAAPENLNGNLSLIVLTKAIIFSAVSAATA